MLHSGVRGSFAGGNILSGARGDRNIVCNGPARLLDGAKTSELRIQGSVGSDGADNGARRS